MAAFLFNDAVPMTQLSIIAGLGNPEDRYERTLHNAGFWFVDALARKFGGAFRYEKKFDAECCRVSICGDGCLAGETAKLHESQWRTRSRRPGLLST